MDTIDVWLAHETTDERGSLGGCVGVFRSQHLAEEAAKGKGFWGGQGTVRHKRGILDEEGRVYVLEGNGVPREFSDQKTQVDIREKALAKLSPAERSALGIK